MAVFDLSQENMTRLRGRVKLGQIALKNEANAPVHVYHCPILPVACGRTWVGGEYLPPTPVLAKIQSQEDGRAVPRSLGFSGNL